MSIKADARNQAGLSATLASERFDVVYDLLSFAPSDLAQTLNIFSDPDCHFVFVSSSTVYSSSARISEDSTRVDAAYWSYPSRKVECERLLAATCSMRDQAYTIFRPYITYGGSRIPFASFEMEAVLPRMDLGLPLVLPSNVADATTSLTHAGDLSKALFSLACNERAYGEALHFASEQSVTWRYVYELAANLMGVQLMEIDSTPGSFHKVFPELAGKTEDRSRTRQFDNSKIHAFADFSQEYTVEAGFETAIRRYRNARPERLNMVTQGRMDRLAATALRTVGARRTGRLFNASSYAGARGKEKARYLVGRSEPLYNLNRRVKSLARKNHQYGLA